MTLQKTTCCDIKCEECNKLAETKKVNVATRVVSTMSTPESFYRDNGNMKKEEILSRQSIFYHDKKLKCNIGRIPRHISLCCDMMMNKR